MNRSLLGAALLGTLACAGATALPAHAQFGGPPPGAPQGTPQGGPQSGGQGATLTLPPSVRKVMSIDAHNMLLAEVEAPDGSTSIVQMKVDHSYTGGIAQLFGGVVVPTLPFVTPGVMNNGGNRGGGASSVLGNGNGGGLGGSGFGSNLGGSGFGGNGLGGNGFGGNGFGGNPGGSGFGGNLGSLGGFNSGSFGPGTTFTGTGIFAPLSQGQAPAPGPRLKTRK